MLLAKKHSVFFGVLGFILWSASTWASIPNQVQEVSLDTAPSMTPIKANLLTKQNVEKFIPSNLTPTHDSEALYAEFQLKFGQKCLDNAMNSNFFKKTPIGQAAESVKKVSEKSISFGSTPAGVTQQVKFQVNLFQHQAQMQYTGYFTSTLVYTMDSNLASMNISKPLSKQTTLILSSNMLVTNPQLSPNLNFVYTF